MRHDVRDVQKERLLAVPFEKLNRPLGEPPRELRLIGIEFGCLVAVDQRQRRNRLHDRMQRAVVIRVRNAEELVESVSQRRELRSMSEMPFAEDRRRIAALLQQFRQQDFVTWMPTLLV